jgi:hypothetical protein
MPCLPFGAIDLFLHLQRSTGKGGEEAQGGGLRPDGIVVPYLRCGGDGPGVDHRVAGPAGDGLKADRVEGVTGGFHSHLSLHVLRGEQGQGSPYMKGLEIDWIVKVLSQSPIE